MNKQTISLPIFPLPVFLLPDGITRLRIFEPRYLKMVAIAIQEKGFVIHLTSNEGQKSNEMWGSWVDIINFNQGNDNILEIDVKCKMLVEILLVEKGDDNLHHGHISYLPHWPEIHKDKTFNYLSKSLSDFFTNNNLLKELYKEQLTEQPKWVVSRWLELLPINHKTKNTFIDKNSFEQAIELIHEIISK